jgi:phosphatidylserine decarboxylase
MYVDEMIEQAQRLPTQKKRPHAVKHVRGLLAELDRIVREAVPVYKKIAFPMSALFVYMMMTPAGEAAFRNERFNNVLREILTEWCTFLDSEKSRSELKVDPGGWLSPEAVEDLRLDDYVTEEDKKKPHWGFTSLERLLPP